MNNVKLQAILADTTIQLRKGPVVTEEEKDGINVVHIYLMPNEEEAPASMVKVDCHFVVIGIDPEKAEEHRQDFIDIVKGYPAPHDLAKGPSYMSVGAVLGDQGAAFQFFGLGAALNLWNVITPAALGHKGESADQMAGMGFVMISPKLSLIEALMNTKTS